MIGRILIAVCLLGTTARAGELMVFAASSLTDALKEIGARYEQTSRDHVTFNFESSSTLARQIAAGAPADVFFSADEAKMDQVQEKGFIVGATRKSILSNTLVIVAEKNSPLNITSPDQLAEKSVGRIALADPKAVPAGIYAKSYLEKLGLWDRVEQKIVPTENVRAALAAVETGNVDAGFVYKTDAAISKKVRVLYTVAADRCPSITYPAAVVKGTRNEKGALDFLKYLESRDAAAIFEKYGFVVLNH